MSWSRACVIELGDAQQAQVSDYITDIPSLRDELHSPRPSNKPRRRVILIELCASVPRPEGPTDSGINIQMQDARPLSALNDLLAEEPLQVGEDFIQNHLQLVTRFDFNEDIRIPGLPSELRPYEQFHLEYFEPRYFVPTELVFPDDDETWTAVCTSTGRAIQCHEWRSGNLLVLASRKVSFWSTRYGDDGSWDGKSFFPFHDHCPSDTDPKPRSLAIILCDPLIKGCVIQDTTTRNLTPSRPFKHGFNIATGRPSPAPCSPGARASWAQAHHHHPEHDSMIGDLRFYFSHHSHLLRRCLPRSALADPSVAATLFARKIVAAHFNHVLAFVTHQAASMRSRGWSLRRANDAEAAESRRVEGQWSRFRCAEFVESLAGTLEALGLPRHQAPQPSCCGGCASKPKRTAAQQQRKDRGEEEEDGVEEVEEEEEGDDNDSSETIVAAGAAPTEAYREDIRRQGRSLCGEWAAVDRDLQHLYRGFEQQRIEYDRITHSIAAFVQMKEAERSLNVAKLTTYFALILTPFAWLASYFSMKEDYLPGGEHVYVYWVVSVGVILLSMLLFQTGSEIKINDKKLVLAARRLGTGWKRNRRGRNGSPLGDA
ncbi:uncharacterized protein E0L32_008962 [Thyridium curvatum]|uniref:Uncharacterized protein n=1 Tax=Thyridium curvatum TaxID=1093900 RepID=A0A507AXX2_9PEZI|nr:uncharacterized protein E0L32_008962 [Thyridium curvatum]TPX09771.1 hypothetical protein E0L32_008962 [Thyridium curvatum]